VINCTRRLLRSTEPWNPSRTDRARKIVSLECEFHVSNGRNLNTLARHSGMTPARHLPSALSRFISGKEEPRFTDPARPLLVSDLDPSSLDLAWEQAMADFGIVGCKFVSPTGSRSGPARGGCWWSGCGQASNKRSKRYFEDHAARAGKAIHIKRPELDQTIPASIFATTIKN